MTTPGPSPAAARIGVIGLPDLAEACTQAGLVAVYDEHPPTALAAINTALETSGPFPVVISEEALERVAAWVVDLCAATHVVVVVAAADPTPVLEATGQRAGILHLPSTLGDLLAAAGYSGIDPVFAPIPVNLDGTLGVQTAAVDRPTTTDHPSAATNDAPAQGPEGDDAPEGAPAVDGQLPAEDLPSSVVVEEPSTPVTEVVENALNETEQLSGAGKVLVVWSGKGGVGKSTTSFAVAQRAAATGLRVVLIDANVGQGDLRTILRAGASSLPSIYQAATSGKVEAAFVDPDQINASRPIKLERLAFSVVQAPPPHVPDPHLVTPGVYRSVVEHARKHYDLVVIDTQIVETVDRFGMVDHLLTPLMLTPRTWGLAITDSSASGVTNLLGRLKAFAHLGAAAHTQLSILNRVPRADEAEIPGVGGALSENSTFLGTVYSDDTISSHINRGRPIDDLPSLVDVLDSALLMVTGDAATFGHAKPSPIPTKADKASARAEEAQAEKDAAPAAVPTEKPTKDARPAKSGAVAGDSFFLRLFRGKK